MVIGKFNPFRQCLALPVQTAAETMQATTSILLLVELYRLTLFYSGYPGVIPPKADLLLYAHFPNLCSWARANRITSDVELKKVS